MVIFEFVSLPSVTVAWIIHMMIGALWYHPKLFGDAFIRLAHRGKQPKPDPQALASAAIGGTLSMPFFALFLSVVSPQSSGGAALWGMSVALFFDFGLNVPHTFFEERPFPLFVLHRGYHITSLSIVGFALGTLCIA